MTRVLIGKHTERASERWTIDGIFWHCPLPVRAAASNNQGIKMARFSGSPLTVTAELSTGFKTRTHTLSEFQEHMIKKFWHARFPALFHTIPHVCICYAAACNNSRESGFGILSKADGYAPDASTAQPSPVFVPLLACRGIESTTG